MTAICRVLGIAGRTAYYVASAWPDGRHHRTTDATVLQQIRAVTNSRATYGYRRVRAIVNRTRRCGGSMRGYEFYRVAVAHVPEQDEA
jgi:hypothetical protein